MDLLSSIFDWLSDHEAGISAVAAILAIAVILFAGFRALHLRGATGRLRKALAGSTRRTRLIAAGAVALLIVAGVAAWLILPEALDTDVASEEAPLLALPTGPTVAVLPFENLSGDPEQEFFSDGLTDEIITELSRFEALFVISRNSSFRYKGEAVDVRRLRKELGARYVLEGSVQKAGTTLRVTAQLLDAKDGMHLWADSYDRELTAPNIFAVQDQITEQVVATIAGDYGVISRARFAEIKGKSADTLDAYECVLKYRAYYRDAYLAPEHEEVRECLEGAVKSDPNYAEVWAGLCWIYIDEYRFRYNPRANPLDRALNAARRAVASDPTSQRAHEALAGAYFYRKELDRFFAEVERTIALNPNDVAALAAMGEMLDLVGDERGIALVRKAIRLDPFHPTWFYVPIARDHFDRGEYEEALDAARKIEIPGYFWPQIYLVAIYSELGRQREASSALEELLRLYPGFSIEKFIEERRKDNGTDASTRKWVEALRKAGLPE
jgi:TolB-like protein